jgi:hypothetical protein
VSLAIGGLGPLTWWSAALVGFAVFAGGVAVGKYAGLRRALHRRERLQERMGHTPDADAIPSKARTEAGA